MSFLRTRRLVFSLALALLWPATAFAQTPGALPLTAAPAQVQVKTTPVAGYRWHTLVLRHAVPSDILALMHWDQPAPAPLPAQAQALPAGVLRIYALQSNNSLLLEATDEGFASVVRLVQVFDRAPRQIQFKTLLIAVPATRAGLKAPDTDADSFLAELLQGERRVTQMPTVTATDGVSVTIPFPFRSTPATPLGGRLRFVQGRTASDEDGLSTRRELRLTPRIKADGTLTVGLTAKDSPLPLFRTLRSGVIVVYELPPQTALGERLFFFLQPTLLDDTATP